VISGGRHLTRALDDTLALYSLSQKYIDERGIKNIYFTEFLEILRPDLRDIEMSLEKALHHYSSISWLPTKELEEQRQIQVENLGQALSYVSSINREFESLKSLLGHEERKKYLIVFQNADEIRPTG